MPLLQVHFRNNVAGQAAEAKLQLTGLGVVVQKLRLVGYTCVLEKDSTTLDQNLEIPLIIAVDIDELGSREVITAETELTANTDKYPHHHQILLPLDDIKTTHFGLNMNFDLNKKLNRNFMINLNHYDETTNKLVPFRTTPVTTGGSGSGPDYPAIANLILYFDYKFSAYE